MSMSTATPFPWPQKGSEKGLSELFAKAPVGVARFSRQGTITEMNPAMQRILRDVPPSSLSFRGLFDPSDQAEADRMLHQMIAGERDCFQMEHVLSGAGGKATWVRWTAWQVPDANGESTYSLLFAEDTTANRLAQGQRARQAERLETLGRIAGGLAHDFNNLVAGVLLYCDLLLAETRPAPRMRRYVDEIRAAALQAASLVKQLLAAARPQDSPPCPLHLNEIVQSVRNLLVRLIGANKKLHLNLDPDLGLVRMKPGHVQQILLNLVLNARDAVPDGGRISIETSNCELQVVTPRTISEPGFRDGMPVALPCAVVVVTDNGCGMDSETKDHMFEPFFTTKSPDHGTGLGLTTVYDIVTGSGGLIFVDTAPRLGTRVTVMLPLFQPAARPTGDQANSTQRNEGATPQTEKELTP